MLYNQATVHEIRGDYRTSEQLLEELLALPGSRGDDHLLLDSYELLACSLFHQGAFEPALDHADEGLGTYDGIYTNPLTAAFGQHTAVSCHTWAALSLWFLGRPEQAVARAREAIVLAESPSRRTGKALALVQAAIVAQCTLDAEQTREWAEAALDEATSRGFMYRIAGSKILRGWALAALGKTDEGVSELREGLAMSRRFGARMDDAYYGGLLADACCRAGALDEGLHALDEALETVRSSRSFFYEAELHRLRGELRLRQGLESDGEASLTEAIEIARRQGAKLLELRAAVSLSRLHAQRGDIDAARELVRTAYATFDEGFGTHDLVAARALLEELGTTVPHPAGQTAERPPVRYARSGELSIAYEVSGGGPPDLVLVPGLRLAPGEGLGGAAPRAFPRAAGLVLAADPLRQARHRSLRSTGRRARPRDEDGRRAGRHGRRRKRARRALRLLRGRGDVDSLRRHVPGASRGARPLRGLREAHGSRRRLPMAPHAAPSGMPTSTA